MAECFKLKDLKNIDKEFIQSSLEIYSLENHRIVDECFDLDEINLYLPLAFARSQFELIQHKIKPTECINFTANLRDEQKTVYDHSVNNLQSDGYSIISAQPGFGKTITALAIACKLRVKTAIVVNKLILIDQWKESIAQFTSSSNTSNVFTNVQYVTSKTKKLDDAVSFYIINAINVRKKPRNFWSPIKFLIVDELHQIVTKSLSQSLLEFVPNCILGLSATPFRFDEYDKAIKWFFGEKKIGNQLYSRHSVIIVKTNWTPSIIRYTRRGKIDWNSILEQQCSSDKRNNLIISNVMKYPEKKWLILVKRVAHAINLKEKFQMYNISCSTLIGSSVTFDKQCRVLIGTTSKIGVGFNHVTLNALCIAADVKNYFIQFLGRCMRNPNVEPLVIDFADKYGPLDRHLAERIKEYKKHGGIVEFQDDFKNNLLNQ